MGRYNFRPLRVHQAASEILGTLRLQNKPPWYDVIGRVPPTPVLVRSQPVQHHEKPKQVRTKKPSKMFKPTAISYEEDKFREQFFEDHPWELARPRVVLENDGKDGHSSDWSNMTQSRRRLDAESVIQRQLWLLHNVPDMTSAKAYDQARHEFYDLRLQEDIERRVAREEAESTGAYFGKSHLEVGMELEDKAYERWKVWAFKETEALQQRRAATQSAGMGGENDSNAADLNETELEAGLEEMEDSAPAQSQDANGGVPVHP